MRVIWIKGAEPIQAWLLLGGIGRCRLLAPQEVEADPRCRSLRLRNETEEAPIAGHISEFEDDASAILGLRLLDVEITPRGPGWRLTLPKILIAIMQIRPKESTVALLLSHGHIEIWSMDALRTSVAIPISELI